MCEYVGFPGYKWSSSSDETDTFPGITCSAIEKPLPGSFAAMRNWWQIARLIELP